jgi:hypothetical protein
MPQPTNRPAHGRIWSTRSFPVRWRPLEILASNEAPRARTPAARWAERRRRPSGAKGSSMFGERDQNARVVGGVPVDVVVAIAE